MMYDILVTRRSVRMRVIGLQNAVRAHYTAAQMEEAGYSKDLAYQLFSDIGKDKRLSLMSKVQLSRIIKKEIIPYFEDMENR